MTILDAVDSGITKVTDQIAKPDHPFWKKVGNKILFVADPVGMLLILIFVPPGLKTASLAVWNAVCITAKGATKFTVDPKVSK